MSRPFPPGDRTYYVSDERLKAFNHLTPGQKLRWVDEVSTFLRLAKLSALESGKSAQPSPDENSPLDNF
jgi:hypothetical protein